MIEMGEIREKKRILGVDPGSRFTGYGCIELDGRDFRCVKRGVIRLPEKLAFHQRLLLLENELNDVIQQARPQTLAVEKVFFAKNAMSALKLGQARGVVLLCGAKHQLEIEEYSATEVKQAVVGYGRADKEQVAKMVRLILGLEKLDRSDESDALAIAITHANLFRSKLHLTSQRRAETTSI